MKKNKKAMKKILSLVLAIVMICGILPLQAAEAKADEGWTIVDNADSEIKYSGNWVLNDESAAYLGTNKIANDPNAYAEFTFTGTAFRWYGQKDSNFGNGKIYVDGSYVGLVNAGSEVGYKKMYCEVTGLENKEHTIRMQPAGPLVNKQNWVEIDYVEYSTDDAHSEVTATAITLDSESLNLKIGGEKTVSAFATNGNKFVGGAYEAKSSDEAVVKVSVNANEIKVEALAAGEAVVTISMGSVKKELPVKVSDGSLPPKRLEISNEKPLLIVPVYCQVYNAVETEMQWGDTLVGRWESIPEDIKPYAVMQIHPGRAGNNVRAFYEQQLKIADEHDIPVMLITAEGGNVNISDTNWLQAQYDKYDVLKGFIIAENYWTNYKRVAAAVGSHMKVAAENGGYVIWYEQGTNVLKEVLEVEAFRESLELYGDNFAFTWKNTPAHMNVCAGTASYIQGLWLNDTIEQWGGLMDTWKWWNMGNSSLFGPNYGTRYSGRGEECRAVVMEPEAALCMEMMSIYGNGGCIYSFEHPAYTYGSYDGVTPAFKAILDTYRYIIDNPAPSKEEIMEDTQVLIHGNIDNQFHNGVTSNDQRFSAYITGRYGLLPAIPAGVEVSEELEEKVIALSSIPSNKDDKIAYFNNIYEETYTGDAFAQEVDGTWILYNSKMNEDVDQSAKVSVGGQSVEVDMTPHTMTTMEREENVIHGYLNNYRVDKSDLWEGYEIGKTTMWNADINYFMQDWITDEYSVNPNDGENTFRDTIYTLTDLKGEPVITIDACEDMEDNYAEPEVVYEADNGTAVITIPANGYFNFTIELASDADKLELQTQIEEASELDETLYTEDTWNAFAEALEKAISVEEDEKASQKEVDDACAALKEAMDGLKEKFVNPFEDVAEGKWYYDAVLWGAENKVVNGLSETLFGPSESCTRGQIVTFIWRTMGQPQAKNPKHSFTDIEEGKYYYDAVVWAVEEGIVNGLTEERFGPNETCTRAQMATFLYRHAEEPAVQGENPFNDLTEGKWYYNAAIWASEQEVVNGYEGGFFAPNDLITRAQTITMLHRYFTDK